LENLPLLKQISLKKQEPKAPQAAGSPSELNFSNLNTNATSSGQPIYKCQSEHQTPIKSFKSFQGDKIEAQAKQPGFVLPSV
jgi:hypothetical protein